jgi:hypothetical protein
MRVLRIFRHTLATEHIAAGQWSVQQQHEPDHAGETVKWRDVTVGMAEQEARKELARCEMLLAAVIEAIRAEQEEDARQQRAGRRDREGNGPAPVRTPLDNETGGGYRQRRL